MAQEKVFKLSREGGSQSDISMCSKDVCINRYFECSRYSDAVSNATDFVKSRMLVFSLKTMHHARRDHNLLRFSLRPLSLFTDWKMT